MLSAALASCGGGGGGSAGPDQLQVLDARSAATNPVDIHVNGQIVAGSLLRGQASPVVGIASGAGAHLQVDPAGTTTTVIDTTLAAQDGQTLVYVLEGSGPVAGGGLFVRPSGAPATGSARLVAGVADPAVGALDIFLSGAADALPALPTATLAAFPGTSASLPATQLSPAVGTGRLRATAAGDATRAVVFDSGPLALPAGTDLALLAVSATGSAASLQWFALPAAGSAYALRDARAALRVAQFAPGLTTEDVTLLASGTAGPAPHVASALAFGTASGYSVQAAGPYTVAFLPAGQSNASVQATQSLNAGTSMSLFAAGLAGVAAPYTLQLMAFTDDRNTPPAGFGGLRVIHLAPDLGTVDALTVDTSGATPVVTRTLAAALAWGGSSGTLLLAPGSYRVAVAATGNTTPLLPGPTPGGVVVSVSAGGIQTLVLAGCRNAGAGICPAGSAPLQILTLTDL